MESPTVQQINISIPAGGLGVSIQKDTTSGECIVSAKTNETSPLQVGDTILTLKGIKLVDCTGGMNDWLKLFSVFDSDVKDLVVRRSIVATQKVGATVDVYHLKYDITRQIIKYPSNKEYYTEDYTQENEKNDSELVLKGQTLLGVGDKIEEGNIKEKAEEEFKKIMNQAFHSISLPDIEIVTESTSTLKKLIILASKTEEGHSKWTWKFNASECRDCDLGPDSIEFECLGNVYVQYERMNKSLSSHVIQYEMNRRISEYGQDCYTDCRPCEREGAEEHFDDEMGYDLCGENVIGYNLTETEEINNKAEQLVTEEVVQEHIADYADANFHSDKILKSIGKDGLYNWKWSFDAKEDEYGCTLEYEGSIVIISKTTPNPNIPNPNKKRRFSTKAPARKHQMRTKIIPLFSDAECVNDKK